MPLYLGVKIPMDPKFFRVSPKFCGGVRMWTPFRDPIPERRVIGGAVLTNTGVIKPQCGVLSSF